MVTTLGAHSLSLPRTSQRRLVWRRAVLMAAAWAAVPACSTPRRHVEHDFRAPPSGWSRFGGGPVQASSLRVEAGRLDLDGDHALVDPTPLTDFAALADAAIAGGDPRGFLGIFVVDSTRSGAPAITLAVRPGGEARVYSASSPLQPAGGRGWQPLAGGATTGCLRLGVTGGKRELRFTVDGTEIERVEVPPATQDSGDRWRIGVLCRGLRGRFHSLVAGDGDASRPFRPESLIRWGETSEALAALSEAERQAEALRARPSRMQVYAVAAAFHEAFQICAQAGDTQQASGVLASAARADSQTRAALRALGEADIHARAFGRLRELAGRKGPAGDADGLPRAAQSRIAALSARARPLRLSYRVDVAAPDPAIGPDGFAGVIRDEYGSLDRAEDGELGIRVRIERSTIDTETTTSTRRVPVHPRGKGQLAELEAESARLARRIETDLADARARAEVNRALAKVIGPAPLAALQTVEVQGRPHDLHPNDGAALRQLEDKLQSVRAKLSKEKGDEPLQYRDIPAKLHTTSILLELSYEVALDGKPLLGVSRERTYLGIEQWSHPRDAATGTPASSHDPARVNAAVDEVRVRAELRLRKAISRENVLPRLDPATRLELLMRLARSSGEERDRSSFLWCLQGDLGVEGPALEKAAAGLLK